MLDHSEGLITVYNIQSPLGSLEISCKQQSLCGIRYTENIESKSVPTVPSELRDVVEELREYFDGRLQVFTIPLHPEGTPFQKRVWAELMKIEYGQTISYQELANRVGDPKAVRAVGGANGKNPIAIIIPCHRVIGASGKLVGYGGGVDRKKWLLRHEQSFRIDERVLF